MEILLNLPFAFHRLIVQLFSIEVPNNNNNTLSLSLSLLNEISLNRDSAIETWKLYEPYK